MLTKNLYSLDEVQACLFHTHDLFWCEELIVSGYIGETISTLFQSWLWNIGSIRLQWLVDAWKTLASDEISEKDILIAAYKLSQCEKDNSLWNILILTMDPSMPDTVTHKTPPFASGNDKEMYFMRAIFQGKARCAWWISQFIEEDRVWFLLDLFTPNSTCLEAFKNYERLLGYRSDEYDTIIRCAAILMCIGYKDSFKEFNVPKIIMSSSYRKYSIPIPYIYGTTVRGRSKWSTNNMDQLNFENLRGCPYWEEAAKEAPEMYEEDFYDKYFPNGFDWSQEEKEKSHGGGVLGPNEKVSLWKYSRNFMSNMSRLAWNTTKSVNSYLKSLDIDCIESLLKLYVKPEMVGNLHPVRKSLIIF